ncbi:hypothetical protein AXL65_02240 [Salmonella enterica subsp. enterica]|nr:hypothetical protein [Salmonella enterica subsp. enterica]
MATTPTTPDDISVLNPKPDQYEGRDNIVPKQVDDKGNSLITGEPNQNQGQLYEAQRSKAVQAQDWDYDPQAHYIAPGNPVPAASKPTLPPAHDSKAEPNWNYNPQDDYVPAGNPQGKSRIAGWTPGHQGLYNPYRPEEPSVGQPDYGWDPSREIPMMAINQPKPKPVLPPKDDVEANMADIWTPDPVYTTGKGTRP